MIDDHFIYTMDELREEWGRDPTYEEVRDYLAKRFTVTKEEEIEYENRKVYGA
jgi:hypothetical protein